MKKIDVREMIVYLLLAMANVIPVGEIYPLGVALFVATILGGLNRYILLLVSGASAFLLLESVIAVKYICIILVVAAIIIMIESMLNTCRLMVGALIASSAAMVVNIAGVLLVYNFQSYIFKAIEESVIIFVATMVFGKMIDLLFTKKTKKDIDNDSGKEKEHKKIISCAESFVSLAKAFSNLPMYKDSFTDDDINIMCVEMADGYCACCKKMSTCWEREYYSTSKDTIRLFRGIIENDHDVIEDGNLALAKKCDNYPQYVKEITNVFEKAKLNLSWYNRLLENREAITLQLNAVAEIMEKCTYEKKDITGIMWMKAKAIKRRLSGSFLQVNDIRIYQQKNGYLEIQLKVLSKVQRCISVKEIAKDVSKVCGKYFSPDLADRRIVGTTEVELILFEDTSYQVLSGVERIAKDGEQKSADNFSYINYTPGEFVACLSDGMGSGIKACKESETVIELIEKFIEAGFSKETALRMINSTMVLEDGQGLLSTIDMCSLDLYSGTCEFYKIGAAPTFIRRLDKVDLVYSKTLPAGIFQKLEIEKTTRNIYDNEFVVMISDGVLDYLPGEEKEEEFADILMSIQSNNPKEFAKRIMDEVVERNNYIISDDMTVMVFGIWEK